MDSRSDTRFFQCRAITGFATSQHQTAPARERAPGSERPAARASELDWLAGQWRGVGLGGQCEESWLPAVGGVLIGTFRLADDGKPVFYEFLRSPKMPEASRSASSTSTPT